jgi:hypothetical protein
MIYQRFKDRRGLLVEQVQHVPDTLNYEARHASVSFAEGVVDVELCLKVISCHDCQRAVQVAVPNKNPF